MKRKPIPRWSDRWIDFVFGFLLGAVSCVGHTVKGRGYPGPIVEMLVAGLIVGTISALFGRRVLAVGVLLVGGT